jgi:hypothetical protein
MLGLGATLDIGSGTRFFTGVRWYHLSNANTIEPNPPRDSLMIYAGVTFPF